MASEQIREQDKTDWIYILKFAAALLITNSHCRDIYPVSWLAIGGGFGNSLFFVISGFLLVKIHLSFGKWYLRRLKRILPATVICLVARILLNPDLRAYLPHDIIAFVKGVLDACWFVFAILIYYIFYYLVLVRNNKIRSVMTAIIIWLAGYIVLYCLVLDRSVFSVELGGFAWFKVYFYFGIMLEGALLRLIYSGLLDRIGLWQAVIAALLGVILWFGEYTVITLTGRLLNMQFVIHLGLIIFAFFTVIVLMLTKMQAPRYCRIVADSTLEIYLVQSTFAFIPHLFGFPVNWLVHFGIAFIGGIMYHYLIDKFSVPRKTVRDHI
ncbi:MAG: acyltransferase [Lachnospiraceae bacterium]|nr:acyltransferase [Lachnospiraceae bacterium]